MSVEISWSNVERILSVHVALPRGSVVIFSIGHPVVGFLWHLSQGSFKGFNFLEPLHVVEDSYEQECVLTTTEQIEETKPELLTRVEEGLKYYPPELCEEGVNGTYFLRDAQGRKVAVFKPNDEEGDSQNNPKRSGEESEFVNKGIPQGEGALREVAAYVLDRNHHFSGVPQTFMATLEHPSFQNTEGTSVPKTGSLQEFVENEGGCEDVGPAKFPVQEVHKISVLDMRIFNNDRHGGNILRRENDGKVELIPIDHGFSLSSTLDRAWFEWLNWPQAKQPFDERTKQFIGEINVQSDAETLRQMGFREEAIRTMVVSTTLLKKGAVAGLNPFQIGTMMCREDLEQPSLLEEMVKDCDGLDALFSRMDEEIASLEKR